MGRRSQSDRALTLLTWATVALLSMTTLASVVFSILKHLSPETWRWMRASDWYEPLLVADSLLGMSTAVSCGVWIYVAGRRLVEAGSGPLQFSPAARIWWFFVPVAFLWKPYQGFRELWNASRGVIPYSTNNLLLATWWPLHLLVDVGGVAIAITQARLSIPLALAWDALLIARAATVTAILIGIRRGHPRPDPAVLSDVFA